MAYAWWHFIDTLTGIFNMIYNSALFLQGVQQVDCRYWLDIFIYTIRQGGRWRSLLKFQDRLYGRKKGLSCVAWE